MERLYSPWRFPYLTRAQDDDGACVFCRIAAAPPEQDESHCVLARAEHHFVVLNLYPYTSGHSMIVPYRHASRLAALPVEALDELARLAARLEALLTEVYRAEGLNFGMNLGRAAGAGIDAHLHLHAVPRWAGDTNFMSVTAETRVLPEELPQTWRKLRGGI